LVLVRCPYCGRVFEYKMPKGKGAHYTSRDFRPNKLHELVLTAVWSIVKEKGRGATKREISYYLHMHGHDISGNSLSGRLSELLGAGLVEVQYTDVKLYDEKSKKYRFKRTPVWYITQRGAEYLRSRGFSNPMGN